MGGERQAPAGVGGHLRVAASGAAHHHVVLPQPLEGEELAGEDEAVARQQAIDEILFHFAQKAAVPQTHLQHRRLHDGADIEAIALHMLEVRDAIKRSEEHTSELQSLMRNSYAVFCLKTKQKRN